MSKILLVDDEAVQRQMLRGFLEDQGYEVLEAENGQEAISIIEREYVPLVLLDHRMPDMNGDEVLERLREINPMVKVIMITAYGAVETAVKVMKLGAVDFLEKPVDLQELLSKVEKHLENLEIEGDVQEIKEGIDELDEGLGLYIGESPKVKEAISVAKRVAATSWPVLLYGETGTGKELMARLIHELSPRRDKPFITVNCAAIPESLFESELFGHVKGAFTGAHKDKKGMFAIAEGGSIFLDEIGEMPLQLQAKLLRVLQEKTITPVGGTKPLEVDVRIISATNRNLKDMIKQGTFREDLYYRLNVFELELPPLRERKEDIPELVKYFIKKYSPRPIKISDEAMDKLVKYRWPGNVRELEHTIQRVVTLARSNTIKASDIDIDTSHHQEDDSTGDLQGKIEALEKREILKALQNNNWVQTKAADELGISERVLRYKMKKYQIKRK